MAEEKKENSVEKLEKKIDSLEKKFDDFLTNHFRHLVEDVSKLATQNNKQYEEIRRNFVGIDKHIKAQIEIDKIIIKELQRR